MNPFNEENPISYRITQMQAQWNDSVTKDTRLVRWLAERDELQMVEGFHKLEASPHGSLPELFINFDQPFTTFDTYGKELTDCWIGLWNHEEIREEALESTGLPDWDDTPYRSVATANSALTFLQCMASFANAIHSETVLALGLMPKGYINDPGFVRWIKKCLENLPPNLKIVVTDLKERQNFKDLTETLGQVTLEPNLNMHEALKEIISSQEDTNNPMVAVNLCLVHIAEAAKDKDKKQIHHWGKQAMEAARETHLKSMEATVLLAYGCALYQLKKFDQTLELFKKAEQASIEGLETDPSAAILLLQAYNMQAAAYFYKRKYTKAQEYYTKAAAEAKAQKNTITHLEASRQAAYCAAKNSDSKEACALLQEAYTEGCTLDVETQKASSMLLICVKLHHYAAYNQDEALTTDIEAHASGIWGENWKDISREKPFRKLINA